MKRNWSEPELDEVWLLSPTELAMLANKTAAARLGCALQLKMLPFEGRFFGSVTELEARPGIAQKPAITDAGY